MSAHEEPDFSSLGQEVSVGEIDRALRRLWEEDEASTNASLINLAVYTERAEDLVRNSELIRELTREHACRAILVGIDRSIEEPKVRAWVTAHCHLVGGRKSVCCEQLAFYMTGRVKGRFRNTLFAHLNSDLPLIFWWQGEPSDVFSERLANGIDRVVIDSASWADPVASYRMILGVIAGKDGLVIQDLAWTRSWQFRVAVAAMFDAPDALREVAGISDLQIVHGPGFRAVALQMLAWFAGQIGWQLDAAAVGEKSSPQMEFGYLKKDGGRVDARIVCAEGAAPLALFSVKSTELALTVRRDPGGKLLRRELYLGSGSSCSVSPADPDEPVDLVQLQLARGGKNSLFQRVLPNYLRLAGDLEPAAAPV